MSRLSQAVPAVRPALPARLVLSGPAGAGKTRTALIVASILAPGGSVLAIDTEKGSALTYADDFDFTHLRWDPPYEPRELGKDIREAGLNYDVVIVDSMSHFWRGEGGVLDIAGGKFTGWKDARPAHADLVEAILDCRAHVILCARSKMEHVQEIENGKHVVRKLGMASVQDDELEYEMNLAIEMDMDHSFTVSKSRTVAVPVGRVFKAGHAEKFAEIYRDWLAGGEEPASIAEVEDLKARMNALPEAKRKECKAKFLADMGRPDHLRATQLDEAAALVARFEASAAPHEGPGSPDGIPGDVAPDETPGDAARLATLEVLAGLDVEEQLKLSAYLIEQGHSGLSSNPVEWSTEVLADADAWLAFEPDPSPDIDDEPVAAAS